MSTTDESTPPDTIEDLPVPEAYVPTEAEVENHKTLRLLQRYVNELAAMTHRAYTAEEELKTLSGN